MNIFQKIARLIIKNSFHLSVWTIELFYDKGSCKKKILFLHQFPDGSLGKDIAISLKENNLRLVPRYESHDLKHILLDYKMNPVDEIRMQAFMIGNGNYSISVFAIFFFGAIILPDVWTEFYFDFKLGRNSLPIKSWKIEEYAGFQTSYLRKKIFHNDKNR